MYSKLLVLAFLSVLGVGVFGCDKTKSQTSETKTLPDGTVIKQDDKTGTSHDGSSYHKTETTVDKSHKQEVP